MPGRNKHCDYQGHTNGQWGSWDMTQCWGTSVMMGGSGDRKK